jgi:WS/DGAT/MGAT family acyltransferase
MTRPLNRRLTSQDASFLYVEKPNQAMHVGSCMIYEGEVSAADLMRAIEQRLPQIPRYRQKAVFSPYGIAHPTWEDDPHFSLRNHVRELTLPTGADERTLSQVGGEVYAPVLDRNHPLWELVVLRGMADGTTPVIWRVHHAMVDGVSGVDLTLVLHDLKPEGEDGPVVPDTWQPRALPDQLSLMEDAVRDQLVQAAQQWSDAAFQWLRPAETAARNQRVTAAMASTMPTMMRPAPRTPFNGPISTRREFAWTELPFAEVRGIRSALGGTVNDVVLTVISGGLGGYLRQRGVSTNGVELRAMCPVSMRRPDERGALGNLVSMMLAPLYVGMDDPVERLHAVRREMDRLKEADQAGALYELTQMSNLIPPAWQALGSSFDVQNTMFNTVCTNVPGPQVPLYLAGRKLLRWYPLGPLASNIGLFNAILSYNQVLTIGATVDPTQVPDAWAYAGFLRESFEELRDAAARAGSSAA